MLATKGSWIAGSITFANNYFWSLLNTLLPDNAETHGVLSYYIVSLASMSLRWYIDRK